jgi:hypothetical protein
LVDKVLNDCRNNHGEHGTGETGLDLLQGSEIDTPVGKSWINNFVEDRDGNEQRERIL